MRFSFSETSWTKGTDDHATLLRLLFSYWQPFLGSSTKDDNVLYDIRVIAICPSVCRERKRETGRERKRETDREGAISPCIRFFHHEQIQPSQLRYELIVGLPDLSLGIGTRSRGTLGRGHVTGPSIKVALSFFFNILSKTAKTTK